MQVVYQNEVYDGEEAIQKRKIPCTNVLKFVNHTKTLIRSKDWHHYELKVSAETFLKHKGKP